MCKGILLAAAWSGLALLMVSGTAQAADWRRVGKSNASEDFIDVSSIHVKGSIRTAWFKSTYPPHTAGPNPKRWWRYSETFNSFDCGPAPFRWTVYRLSFLTSSSSKFFHRRSLPPKAVEALGFCT
jgi:hypothetical protein